MSALPVFLFGLTAVALGAIGTIIYVVYKIIEAP